MIRTLPCFALLLVACLSTGESSYGKLDEIRPHVVSIPLPLPDGGIVGQPAVDGGSPSFSGGVPSLDRGSIIAITFSEPMDLESLRPGIAIRNKDRKEQNLSIQLDPEDRHPVTAADREIPQRVHVSSADLDGFATGVYQLVLRTLLIDQQGNELHDGPDLPDAGVIDIDLLVTFSVKP